MNTIKNNATRIEEERFASTRPISSKPIQTGKKVNNGVQRSVQVISDKVLDTTQSTLFTLAEYASKPRPKVISFINTVSKTSI